MKVALISQENSRVGKTSLAILLTIIFSNLKNDRASIFTNVDAKDYNEYGSLSEESKASEYMSVFRANLKRDTVDDEELYTYGRIYDNSLAYVFNIRNSTMSDDDMSNMFLSAVSKSNSKLTIVDINGNYMSDENVKVLEECDAILYLFEPNKKEFDGVLKYKEDVPYNTLVRTGFICSKWNQNAISEKLITESTGIAKQSLMTFPYTPLIQKESLNRGLDKVAIKTFNGYYELLLLRSKIQEILGFLFNESKFRYIPSIKEWGV